VSRAARQAAVTAKLQAECDKFNDANPVGTTVHVRLDSGKSLETVTTSDAQVMGGHSVVIWLDGISGCYDLERVTPAMSKAAA